MKRAQRRTHLATWLVLAPILAGVIVLAISQRPGLVVNDTLPSSLTEEER